MSSDDRFIPIRLYLAGMKQVREKRPPDKTSATRNLFLSSLLLQIGQQDLQKVFTAEKTLPFQVFPGRFRDNAGHNKFPIVSYSIFKVIAELGENPIGREKLWFVYNFCRCRITGPWIIAGMCNNFRSNRIEDDVPAQFKKVFLFLNEDCFVPALE